MEGEAYTLRRDAAKQQGKPQAIEQRVHEAKKSLSSKRDEGSFFAISKIKIILFRCSNICKNHRAVKALKL